MDLLEKSIKVILENQSENGAYVASPSFDIYHYCWLRDGSYIAYAMDIAGEHASAEDFYRWVDSVILRYGSKVDTILEKLHAGEPIDRKDFMNARYTLSGFDEKEEGWGNFQLDGYGTWLWGLAKHVEMTGNQSLLTEVDKSITKTVEYIENLWFYPNYDIWEENGDKIHTSTLSCLYGGLTAINEHLKKNKIGELAARIKTFLLTNCIVDGHFVKFIGTDAVDSSLVWLGVPFQVVDLSDDVFKATMKQVREELVHAGGTHRFLKDTYYGGGEWLLLSSWIGWYDALAGDSVQATEMKTWVEAQADVQGNLPEQVCTHINNEVYYPYWVHKWGQVASPLLWSHAMYIILSDAIEKEDKSLS